jgi:predicted aspartyl protease
MGKVMVTVEVYGTDGASGKSEAIELVADTGATLTVLPREMLLRMGVSPIRRSDGTAYRVTAQLATGQKVEREVGEVRLRVEGDSLTTRVLFGEAGDAGLLGVIVLESLGLTVDPVRRRLVRTDYLLL